MKLGPLRAAYRRGFRLSAFLLAGSAVFALLAGNASAQGWVEPRNNFGSVGLIEMPSARMATDGELTVGASFLQDTQRYNLGFQALSWLETSFRYSGLQRFDPNYPVYFDRAFGIKARLWNESGLLPAVAVGVTDIVGSGIYNGEYLVASKQFGSVDATIGIGWGRFSDTATFSNPLTLLSDNFKTRSTDLVAGGTNFSTLFHGPKVGIFGGAVWHTPIEGLSLIAEYSSDQYKRETVQGQYRPLRQINVGASYSTSFLTMGLSWIYGNRVSASLVMRLNPVEHSYPSTMSAPPLPVHVRNEDEQKRALAALSPARNAAAPRRQDATTFVDAVWSQTPGIADIAISGSTLTVTMSGNTAVNCRDIALQAQALMDGLDRIVVRGNASVQECRVAPRSPLLQPVVLQQQPSATVTTPVTIDASAHSPSPQASMAAIRTEAGKQDLPIQALQIRGSELVAYYSNNRYFKETEAVDRLTRILMQSAPPEVERFRLVSVINSLPVREFTILRMPTERRFLQDEPNLLDWSDDGVSAPLSNPVLSVADRTAYPKFDWGLFPRLRQALFDPNQPLGLQLLLEAQGSVELFRGLTFNAGLESSLYDDFTTSRLSDSVLPHVRTDFVNYFSKGKNGISSLDMQYRFRLSPEVFAVAKAGLLESMFAGVGGEILWRPENRRWALGVDAYGVQQRGFTRLFTLQNYTTFTGHVSLYYQSPWYDLNFALRAGQYLAGDRGFTFEMTRRFSTGVEIGAFFTRTNVSATDFGEGSFDKGIIIRIPLGWSLPIDTQAIFGMDLRPIQRDGGQRLTGDTTLFEETRRASQGEMFYRN